MRKIAIIFCILIAALASVNGQWKYKGKISFPASDSVFVQPFLCTVADDGRLYVASSKSTNLNAHDAIYVLKNTADTVLTRMVDYTAAGDTINVRMLTGITHIKNDILVSAKVNPSVAPGGRSCAYYYINGDPAVGTRYGYDPSLAGWGTYVLGVTSTRDSIVFGGTDYTKGIRAFNFTSIRKFAAMAAYISPDNTNVEPGGPSTGGFDVIRDVATLQNGDYFDPMTPFFTSRNSKTTGEISGGIAAWTGGTQYKKSDSTSNHQGYTPIRVLDADFYLAFNSSIPFGITCDKNGLLWVAGIDSTRRWVKAFEINLVTSDATYKMDLPSSKSVPNPVATGAPMMGPCDVAFNKEGDIGYVIDAWSRCVYKFSNTTAIDDKMTSRPYGFEMSQNYPNPFNPSTSIRFSVPSAMDVKLSVINALGQQVAVLYDGFAATGVHSVEFNAKNLPSGIYIYTLQGNNYSITKKMVVLK